MQPFEKSLGESIEKNGPITLGEFMARAVSYYYATRDPFGVKGDFTTAPEISQIFGELLGAWIVDTWHKLKTPEKFYLLECGPGRGTLMQDALRVTGNIKDFQKAISLHLLETSSVLMQRQAGKLSSFHPVWHQDISSIPTDAPWIMIANEFLDALPIEQMLFQDGVWLQRFVTCKQGVLSFVDLPAISSSPENRPENTHGILEIAPLRDAFWRTLCSKIKQARGAALIIDYGYMQSASGDTLQAVMQNKHAQVLKNVGEADLTAHVNFKALCDQALAEGLDVAGPLTQAKFLTALGLHARLSALLQSANAEQAALIKSGADRLIDENQMGRLFKVLAVSSGLTGQVEGFYSGYKSC